jgi:hypothetical protein
MQNSKIVTGLPKFKVDGMHKICEACQFGKQTKNVFPHDALGVSAFCCHCCCLMNSLTSGSGTNMPTYLCHDHVRSALHQTGALCHCCYFDSLIFHNST